MISVLAAQKRILTDVFPNETIDLPIRDALGLCVANDITAEYNIPAADNSAMDGYAVRHLDTAGASSETPVALTIIGEARAGAAFSGTLSEGTAVRIMTGALIPDGADAVVPIESTREDGGMVQLARPVIEHDYVRFSGEDINHGALAIPKLTRLKPAGIGILASLRKERVTVFKRPDVAILCTGDELVGIDTEYSRETLVSSNAYSLAAQVVEAGGNPILLGIVKDEKKVLAKNLKYGLQYDYLITSGGISAGKYDLIKETLEELGAECRFHKVAMRPGKPFTYFTHGDSAVFALPGNPVSCMVAFEIFVRPAIRKTLGYGAFFRSKVEAVLTCEIRKSKAFTFFPRGIIEGDGSYTVTTTGPQGSGILNSMSRANCLIIADEDKESLKKGETVKVIITDDDFCNSKLF